MPNDFTPFVGPRPFKREDAHLFFGRTNEADEMLSLVVSEREVLLYAQSGAGKTSLLNAGLRPKLEVEGFEVLPIARVRYESREEIQTRQVANVYVFNVLAGWSALAPNVKQLDKVTLANFLAELPPQLDKEGLPRPRLLIFDQFEELFTFYPERAGDRRGFFEQVRDALNRNRLLRVIFAMREEYIAELTSYATILPEKLRTRFRLERLREPAALEAVTEPLAHSRYSFAPDVAEELVGELLQVNVGDKAHPVRGEYVEPVQLQVVCDALCRRLPPNTSVITLEHVQRFGSVNEALANFYKGCLKQTTRTTHVWGGRLRKWFGETLITPEGVRDAIRQGPKKTGGLPNKAVQKLEELHLIRGEERPGRGRWYELTHDRFIGPIQEVNRIAGRHVRIFQSIAAGAAILILAATCLALYQNYTDFRKANAFMNEGAEFFQAGKHKDAVKQFEQALGIAGAKHIFVGHRFDPVSWSAHVQAANSYVMLRQHDQAASHYLGALKVNSKSADDGDRKKKDFSLHVALGQVYYWQGAAADAGDADVCFGKARAEIDEASKLNPESADPDILRGHIEFNVETKRKGKDYSAAEKYYLEANKKDQRSQDAYRGLAMVHLFRERADEVDAAIQNAREAVKLRPDLPDSHTALGEAYYSKGNYDGAAAELNRAIGLRSTDYEAHFFLGWLYYTKENYELAKIEFDEALKFAESENNDSWMAEFYSGLGYVALKQHDRDLADSQFNEALNCNPKRDGAYFGRGLLLFSFKEAAKAEAQWYEALRFCNGTTPSERMDSVIYELALGIPGGAEEMSSILAKPPPISTMEGALDSVDLLVALKVHPEEGEKIRDMLAKAIQEARNQPVQKNSRSDLGMEK